MKLLIFSFIFITSECAFSQVPIEFCVTDAYEEFDFLPIGYVDTASLVDKKYLNGQIKWTYYLNDSSWIDSFLYFHQNGNIASRIVFDHFTPMQGKWQVNQMPNYYSSSFYKSGKLRSEEFNSYLDKKQLSIKKSYLDSSNVSLYETKYTFGDTIEGIYTLEVLQWGREPIVLYGRYKNNKLLDTWLIKGHLTGSPTILKISKLSDKIELLKDEEIELEMKKYCFCYINNHFGIVEILR